MDSTMKQWEKNLEKELNRIGLGLVNNDKLGRLIEAVIAACPYLVTVHEGKPVNTTNRPYGDSLLNEANGVAPVKGYELLERVLVQAYAQASHGKGKERHADGRPFHEQPMQTIAQQVGVGFITGQAMKKLGESTKMDRDAAIRELLGAIVYSAGAVIFLERNVGTILKGEATCLKPSVAS
jgi:hypothetical protein